MIVVEIKCGFYTMISIALLDISFELFTKQISVHVHVGLGRELGFSACKARMLTTTPFGLMTSQAIKNTITILKAVIYPTVGRLKSTI